jgi:Leucine-rich repeat (LRR) protein
MDKMPKSLEEFPYLHRLDMSDNQLASIEERFDKMHMLVELLLYNNKINTLSSR